MYSRRVIVDVYLRRLKSSDFRTLVGGPAVEGRRVDLRAVDGRDADRNRRGRRRLVALAVCARAREPTR